MGAMLYIKPVQDLTHLMQGDHFQISDHPS